MRLMVRKVAYPSGIGTTIIAFNVGYGFPEVDDQSRRYVHRHWSFQEHAEGHLIQQIRDDIEEREEGCEELVADVELSLFQNYSPCDDYQNGANDEKQDRTLRWHNRMQSRYDSRCSITIHRSTSSCISLTIFRSMNNHHTQIQSLHKLKDKITPEFHKYKFHFETTSFFISASEHHFLFWVAFISFQTLFRADFKH